MNVPNLNQEILQQLLPEIQKLHPGAFIKKPWIGPEMLRVPYENFHFVATQRKAGFKLDFLLPTAWSVGGFIGSALIFSAIYTMLLGKMTVSVGGALPVLVGFLIVKSIFKSRNKEKIEQFNNEFVDIVNGIGKE